MLTTISEKEQRRLAEQVREILVVGQIDGTGKDTLFASSMDPYNEDCKIVVKKLKECCTYSFKMIARNKCGTSAKSNAVKVTTRQIGEKEEKETDLDLRNHRIYDESWEEEKKLDQQQIYIYVCVCNY